MKNETTYLVNDKVFETKESQMPNLKDDDILVEIKHIGICGSDIMFFDDHTAHGALDYELPIVLGHECAGVVVELGAKVQDLKVGDKVALEPGVPCGECEYCKTGRYNLCGSVDFMAAPPFISGAMSKYVSHPAKWSYKLPEHVTTMEGALLEPLSVGMYAVKRGNPQLGDAVTILGAGCIGLMTLVSLKARGIDDITVIDLFDNRLEMAMELGAKRVVNSSQVDMVNTMQQLTDGKGTEYVFETAGNPITANAAAKIVKTGGKVVMVGQIHQLTEYDFFEINMKEVDLINVFRYANIYPIALDVISTGKIDVKKMVTKSLKKEESQQAFEYALYNKQDAVKVVIEY